MRFVPILFFYYVIYFIMNLLTLNFPAMFLESLTPGSRISGSIGHQYFIQKRKRIQINDRGKGFY